VQDFGVTTSKANLTGLYTYDINAYNIKKIRSYPERPRDRPYDVSATNLMIGSTDQMVKVPIPAE